MYQDVGAGLLPSRAGWIGGGPLRPHDRQWPRDVTVPSRAHRHTNPGAPTASSRAAERRRAGLAARRPRGSRPCQCPSASRGVSCCRPRGVTGAEMARRLRRTRPRRPAVRPGRRRAAADAGLGRDRAWPPVTRPDATGLRRQRVAGTPARCIVLTGVHRTRTATGGPATTSAAAAPRVRRRSGRRLRAAPLRRLARRGAVRRMRPDQEYASTGGQLQTRLRSPCAPSMRRTGGQTLRSCTPGTAPVG